MIAPVLLAVAVVFLVLGFLGSVSLLVAVAVAVVCLLGIVAVRGRWRL